MIRTGIYKEKCQSGSEIEKILVFFRENIARQVNDELLETYGNIGRIICENEQSTPDCADYGEQALNWLSKALTKEFGKGFSRANLYNMRLFYQVYEKSQTLSGKLSWSHDCELLSISDPISVVSMKKMPGMPTDLLEDRSVIKSDLERTLVQQIDKTLIYYLGRLEKRM